MSQKARPFSLYFKLTLVFLGTLFLLGFIQLALSARGWVRFVEEAQQRLFSTVATTIAHEIEPFTESGLRLSELEASMQKYLIPPQLFQVYLLDADGRIVYHPVENLPPARKKIAIEPVLEFIQGQSIAEGAILGEDPISGKLNVVFSAAPILIDGEQGYLYVSLSGVHYQNVLEVLGRSYFLQISLLGIPLSLIAAAVIGMFSFSLLTKPLQHLTRVVRTFGQGDYSVRAEVNTRDELRELADTMNTMAGVIETQIDELRQQDTLRRELIANISHDLKTPLTSLGGTIEAELARFDDRSREELRGAFERAYRNFVYTKGLVSELFELSSLEARVRKPNFQAIPVDELIEDYVASFRDVAAAKNQDLTWDLPDTLPLAYGDFSMIAKVISNLVQNALRYTPEGSSIQVKADSNDACVSISVSDTGDGIAEDDIPLIFNRFYRASDRERSDNSGSGLGLAIVKEIIDIHDSHIAVESTLGSGTTFRFELKRADAISS